MANATLISVIPVYTIFAEPDGDLTSSYVKFTTIIYTEVSGTPVPGIVPTALYLTSTTPRVDNPPPPSSSVSVSTSSTLSDSVSATALSSISTIPSTVVQSSTSISSGGGISTTPSSTAAPAPTSSITSQSPTASTNGTITTPLPVAKSTKYSAGSVAGAVVGSAIGAAIIAALLVWFFMRRKNRYSKNGYDASDPHESQQLQTFEKSPVLVTAGASSAASIVETHLPQPETDGAIKSELSKIDSLIEQHVDNFYHTASVPGAKSIQPASLPWLENNPDLSVGELKTLLANPKTRINALRYAISRTITSHCEANSPPGATFLPPALAMVVNAVGNVADDEVQSSFLTKYRQITTFLLQPTLHKDFRPQGPNGNGNGNNPPDPRYEFMLRALSALDSLLLPYAHARTNEERKSNLLGIMQRAANFALKLFGQPQGFRFDWDLPRDAGVGVGGRGAGGGGMGFVVWPSLVVVSDENGRRVSGRRGGGAGRGFGEKRVGS
ncbi:MAG: hypothetical protein MMC33_004000 [Icmadophila ericetorum]|nr:hypothetical protein [Icmadophila ericetorum]